jgi:hypothetical protein
VEGWRVRRVLGTPGRTPGHRAGGEPAVVDLRCRLCLALGRWGRGAEYARALATAGDKVHHVTAAEFCVAHARHLASTGDKEAAHAFIQKAVRCWGGGRMQTVEDDLLMGLY